MFIIPGLLASVYAFLFVATFEGLHATFPSLDAVAYVVHTKTGLLAAWVHFLAFDLFVGAWIVRDSRRLRISHVAAIPCLLLTFLLGPLGLLAYLIVRLSMRKGSETP